MHGVQKIGAVNRVLCHVMWAIISKPQTRSSLVHRPNFCMGHSVLQNNRNWTLIIIRKLGKLESVDIHSYSGQ